jgi:nucleoside-diphosphate-sugar epimerase
MKVLVTGGTGFVGSHTVAAVSNAGHDVRLLVRSAERVRPALDPLGVGDVEAVVGDVTDRESVRDALVGCDAVIHAASVFSFDARRNSAIRRTNVEGTDVVLGLAADAGIDPIVHVSSTGALIGEPGATLTPDSPPGTAPGAYWRSKAASDVVARRYQQQGAPVVITYPGSVWGPHDPHLGETCLLSIGVLKGNFRFSVKGGLLISDVRDIAELHAAVLVPERGARRYLGTMTRVALHELIGKFASLTGRDLKTTALPAGLVLAQARVLDAVQRVAPFRVPLQAQPILHGVLDPGYDDSRTRDEFGLAARDIDETVRDTLRWLYDQGHISAKLAGRIAD